MNTSITESSTVANEGGTITFTVTSPNTSLNKYLYWTTEQYGQEGNITASDFSDTLLQGNVYVWQTSQTFTRTIARDRATEGTERFQITLREGGYTGIALTTSNVISVNDTSTIVGQDSNGKTYGPILVNQDSGVAAKREKLKYWMYDGSGYSLQPIKKLATTNPISWDSSLDWHKSEFDSLVMPKISGVSVLMDYHRAESNESSIKDIWLPSNQNFSAKISDDGYLETNGPTIDRILGKVIG